MSFRGGEFSTGTIGNLQPGLTKTSFLAEPVEFKRTFDRFQRSQKRFTQEFFTCF
jgi:hypothetical protein